MVRVSRKLKSGNLWQGYYYNGRDGEGRRIKIPLGQDLFEAKQKWADIERRASADQSATVANISSTKSLVSAHNKVASKRASRMSPERHLERWMRELIDLCKSTKARAKRKDIEFSLLPEDLLELFVKGGGKCALSGIVFSERWESGHRIRLWYPSVDRIDSTKGYHLENVRLVCAYVNVILNQFGESLLLDVSQKIANHMQFLRSKSCAKEAEIVSASPLLT